MLIGLNGRAGSGKDLAFTYIRQLLPDRTVIRDAFADRLKWSAARIFNPTISLEDGVAWCNQVKNSGHVLTALPGAHGGVDGRQFLQNYGTEAHRDVFGDTFWIDAVLGKYEHTDDWGAYVNEVLVITDVRFANEARAVREAGGEIWLIARDEVDKGDIHASEALLPPYLIDTVVDNNGDLDHFRDEIRYALAAAHAA